MHDAAADIAEVPLSYGQADEIGEKLAFELVEAEGGGTLEITWAEHRWSTPFTVAN